MVPLMRQEMSPDAEKTCHAQVSLFGVMLVPEERVFFASGQFVQNEGRRDGDRPGYLERWFVGGFMSL